MKIKLGSCLQNIIFLALIGTGVVEYNQAIKQKPVSQTEKGTQAEVVQKIPLWSNLLNDNLVGSFGLSKVKTASEEKAIINVENYEVSILPFSSYMDFNVSSFPFSLN